MMGEYRDKYVGCNVQRIERNIKYMTVFMIVCSIVVALSFILVISFHDLFKSIIVSPFLDNPDQVPPIVLLLSAAIYVYPMGCTIIPIYFIVGLLYWLKEEFRVFSSDLRNWLHSTGDSYKEINTFRKRHIALTRIVTKLDVDFTPIICAAFACGLPFLCIMLFAFFTRDYWRQTSSPYILLLDFTQSCSVVFFMIIILTISAASLSIAVSKIFYF